LSEAYGRGWKPMSPLQACRSIRVMARRYLDVESPEKDPEFQAFLARMEKRPRGALISEIEYLFGCTVHALLHGDDPTYIEQVVPEYLHKADEEIRAANAAQSNGVA